MIMSTRMVVDTRYRVKDRIFASAAENKTMLHRITK